MIKNHPFEMNYYYFDKDSMNILSENSFHNEELVEFNRCTEPSENTLNILVFKSNKLLESLPINKELRIGDIFFNKSNNQLTIFEFNKQEKFEINKNNSTKDYQFYEGVCFKTYKIDKDNLIYIDKKDIIDIMALNNDYMYLGNIFLLKKSIENYINDKFNTNINLSITIKNFKKIDLVINDFIFRYSLIHDEKINYSEFNFIFEHRPAKIYFDIPSELSKFIGFNSKLSMTSEIYKMNENDYKILKNFLKTNTQINKHSMFVNVLESYKSFYVFINENGNIHYYSISQMKKVDFINPFDLFKYYTLLSENLNEEVYIKEYLKIL